MDARSPFRKETYSQQSNRRETLTRIYLPVILSAVLMLVFLILLIVYGGGVEEGIAKAGDMATVLVILPQFLGLLISLAFLGGLAYGVVKLKEALPGNGAKILNLLHKIQLGTHKATNAAVKPSIKTNALLAQLRQVFASLKFRLQ